MFNRLAYPANNGRAADVAVTAARDPEPTSAVHCIAQPQSQQEAVGGAHRKGRKIVERARVGGFELLPESTSSRHKAFTMTPAALRDPAWKARIVGRVIWIGIQV